MNLCLATYGSRLATLLENASELHFYQVKGLSVTPKGFCPMPAGGPSGLLLTLHSFGMNALACGGVSPHYLDVLRNGGVKAHAWLSGDVNTVLRAFTEGHIDSIRMPGAAHREGSGPKTKRGA